MGVSGIGTSSTYLYDATTGKLSTKDGTKIICRLFNGDSSEETLEDLNGFDKIISMNCRNFLVVS